MKKLIIASLMLFGTAAYVQAQDSTAVDRNQNQSQNMTKDDYSDKDVITTDQLPATIQTQLQSDQYRSWTVSKAYRKMKDGQTYYAVDLTNGNDKKKVKFDEQGNMVKEKDK